MPHAYRTSRYVRGREPAWALGGLAASQKVTAAVLGLDQSTVSRQARGEQAGDVARFYDVVAKAVGDERTRIRAGRLIAGAMSVAQEVAARLTPDDLRGALDVAHDYETTCQHAEDTAQHRVLRAIARCGADDASPEDLEELAEAIEVHDAALTEENAAHAAVLYLARAYLAATQGERPR